MSSSQVNGRAESLFHAQMVENYIKTDRLFALLMVLQWAAAVILALLVSPKTWYGAESEVHIHVWAAFGIGGVLASFVGLLVWKDPGKATTRYCIAVSQMLFSSLLVQTTAGRIETHFHIFGSLAFLAFYRDWRVILIGTVVTAADHFLRGFLWPMSIYGVVTESNWRWLEHAGWVIFEDIFLLYSCSSVREEIYSNALNRAILEDVNSDIEAKVQDRTRELDRKNAQLESVSRYKSEFLANMSHEIRTPMNAIIGFTELALESQLDSEQRESLESVKRAGHGLLRIINDILDFSKVEAGKMSLDPEACELALLLKDTFHIFHEIATRKNLEFVLEISPNLPKYVLLDQGRVRQILINLLGNSTKFARDGKVFLKCILVKSELTRHLIRFEVIDFGIGISKDKIDEIFSPFTQGDASTTRKFGGTGLGLAISKKLVELMGGVIGVESELGKYTRFWFELECNETIPELPEAQTIPKVVPSKKSYRILVADDVAANRILAQKLLEKEGYQVECVANGSEVLKTLIRSNFDLILMDCHMPEMDGFEATTEIRKLETGKGHRTTIVALTASAMEGDMKKCLELGMDDFLSKPVSRAALSKVLSKWLK